MSDFDPATVQSRDTFDVADLQQLDRADFEELAARGSWKVSLERIQHLRDWMNESLVGRDDLIELMLMATAAQLPMLMLGTWGTAKSLLVRKLAQGLGISSTPMDISREGEFLKELMKQNSRGGGRGKQQSAPKLTSSETRRHFEYLVTRFTTPEEILGSANIQLMLDEAVYMRQTRGLLPQAEIVFLDEVFKANSSILNALLSIINERVFHNAGRAWRVKLMMLFGASNEPPQEDDLGAFYDRFPVRCLVEPVTGEQLPELLESAHRNSFDAVFGDSGEPKLSDGRELPCINDFRLLHGVSLVMFGGHEISDGTDDGDLFEQRFTKLFEFLRMKFDLSDRSFAQYYRLARVRALLKGRTHMESEDVRVLQHCGKGTRAVSELRGIVDQFIE